MIRGVIYDLDGTLVDSRLDFEAMRREMDLPAGTPILEALDELTAADERKAERCREVLRRHEAEGARRSAPLPGVVETLMAVRKLELPQGIVTRNSRAVADIAVRSLPDVFDLTLTRDDGPAKPSPWAIEHLSHRWRLSPAETVIVGDFRHDIEAGVAAGSKTVLLHHGRDPESLGVPHADLMLSSLEQSIELLAWLQNA